MPTVKAWYLTSGRDTCWRTDAALCLTWHRFTGTERVDQTCRRCSGTVTDPYQTKRIGTTYICITVYRILKDTPQSSPPLQPSFSCSSRVRMSPTFARVVSLRCGHDGSSSSSSSEEVRTRGRIAVLSRSGLSHSILHWLQNSTINY